MQVIMQRTLPILALTLLLTLLATASTASAAPISRLLAPVTACPDQTDTDQPPAVQERAMHCLTNFARERAGLRPLGFPAELVGAAERKAGDILRCDSFSHQACGRDFTYWLERTGYLDEGCWRAGENIAWGTGNLGSPREIFDAWMRSPGHRENILGRYSQVGIGLWVGSLRGHSGAAVWVQEFGSHC